MITVYFDYGCPFAWRGLELINTVAPALGLEFSARHYSLAQGNHPSNTRLPRGQPVWRFAEQPEKGLDERQRRSRQVFLASHAARLQGKSASDRFALELLRSRHRDRQEFTPDTTLEAARRAELDLEQFRRDWADEPARLTELAADLRAADEIAVFGTPTFVLEDGHAAYFRFREVPAALEDQVKLWRLYVSVLENGAVIETIKRPRK